MRQKDLDAASPWRACQQRERFLLGLFLGYLPGVAAIGFPLTWLFNSDTPAMIVAGVWLLALATSSIALNAFKCPRCGKPFFRTWWYVNHDAQKCVHCGLPKCADPKHG